MSVVLPSLALLRVLAPKVAAGCLLLVLILMLMSMAAWLHLLLLRQPK